MGKYADQVHAGMTAVNNDIGESWVDVFDLDIFDPANIYYCILGQNYSGYSEGLTRLSSLESYRERFEFAVIHGFDLGAGVSALDWDDLRTEWVSQITAQKEQGKGKK